MNYFSKSKIFLLFLISFIAGIAGRSFFAVSIYYIFMALVLTLIILIFFWPVRKIKIAGFCFLFIILGLGRYTLSISEEPIIPEDLLKEKIEITGLVYEETEESEQIRKIKVKIKLGPPELIGLNFLITSDLNPVYQYGDLVKVSGKIQRPEKIQDFDYPAYLARFKIYLVSYKPRIEKLAVYQGNAFLEVIYSVKEKFAESIKRGIPEPESSFFAALSFGIKTKLPAAVAADFSRTGITHIMAISGQNMTIIAGLLMNFSLAIGLRRKQAFWLASAVLFLFTVLIGLPASAVRASVMAFLVLWAMSLGRLNHSLNAIILAAVAMLLFNPQLLKHDVGFQLSFLAVLGLIYISPWLEKILKFLPELLEIKSSLVMTLSAQVFTLPIIIYNFKIISLISPLANVLILPIFSLLLTLGLAATFVSLIFWPIGQLLFWLCYLLLKYITSLCHFFANHSWAAISFSHLNVLIIFLIYLIMFAFFKLIKSRLPAVDGK
ncbi:MAG: ComEC/Rec2 family competence protein [Patescibacteria group bacterium]